MISRGLLLGLLVLTCLQLFTKALNANGPDQCCFRYQRNPIPIRVITGYKVTERHCAKPAVIFTLMNSRQSFTTANNSNEPATCCFGYYESPIPFRVITEYKVTHPHCTKPGVFFTLKKDNRQSFATANNSVEPETCCFSYYESPIPIRVITGYKVTDRQCTKPAVIFTLKNSRRVCVDPEVKWVQNHMKRIDQNLYKKLIQSQMSV
ncbi:hypothetical protein HF521_020072 [Silurus meridionalis]|uniref:C-C motif chemokine n=1 Tax=Silurus meridionalis TaxID=175797 RepID=A0A8T0BID1_SILME|nr:hypothetical protein HF521_020072 [Silurus meridionalis]